MEHLRFLSFSCSFEYGLIEWFSHINNFVIICLNVGSSPKVTQSGKDTASTHTPDRGCKACLLDPSTLLPATALLSSGCVSHLLASYGTYSMKVFFFLFLKNTIRMFKGRLLHECVYPLEEDSVPHLLPSCFFMMMVTMA